MRWFKHDVNASNDIKLVLLTKRYGLEGYGVYFKILELICSTIESDNMETWGYLNPLYNDEFLAEKFQIGDEKWKKLKKSFLKLKLFQLKHKKIYCPQILKRLDEYAERSRRGVYGNLSGQSRDNIGSLSGIDKIRKDKIRRDKREDSDLTSVREILETKL